MDFSLSPTSDVQINLSFKQPEVDIKQIDKWLERYAKEVYEHFLKTGQVRCYLSLEHPSVKKTYQRLRQRRHHRRSAYYVGRKRAQKWLRVLQAEKTLASQTKTEAFIPRTGQLHNANKTRPVPKPGKGRQRYMVSTPEHGVLTIGHSRKARQVHLFEDEQLQVSKPTGPVPEPTPTAFEHHKIIAPRKKNWSAYPAEEKMMRTIFGKVREK